MFFVISKLFWFFADPFSVVMLPGLIGLVLCLTRFARVGRGLCVLTVLLLAIACFSPLSSSMRPHWRWAPRLVFGGVGALS